MISYKDELRHSGIKGMRWGIRKYRNYDGTLTAAGKARFGADNGEKKQTRSERKISKAKAAKKEAKAAEREAKKATEELKKERAELEEAKKQKAEQDAKDRIAAEQLTNAELKAKIERLTLEKQYNSLVNPPPQAKAATKSALDKGKEMLTKVGGVLTAGKTILDTYQAIDKLRNPDKYKEKDPNKSLKIAEEAARLKSSIQKAAYDEESRNVTRARWAKEAAEASAGQWKYENTNSWANPSSFWNSQSKKHAESSWTDDWATNHKIYSLPAPSSSSGDHSYEKKRDTGSSWASSSGLLGLPAPSSSNSGSSWGHVVGYYDDDGKFHKS